MKRLVVASLIIFLCIPNISAASVWSYPDGKSEQADVKGVQKQGDGTINSLSSSTHDDDLREISTISMMRIINGSWNVTDPAPHYPPYWD